MDLNSERGAPYPVKLGAAIVLVGFIVFLVLSFLGAVIK